MNNSEKFIVSAVTAMLSAKLGILYVPILLMVLCNVMDYVTGLMAASYRNDGISSYRSIRGIFKKIGMWLLVMVGFVMDQLLIYTSNTLGHEWPIPYFVAAVVTIWIICNEIISILENLIDIGIKIPKFLMPLVKKIQKVAENTVTIDEKESEEKSDEN